MSDHSPETKIAILEEKVDHMMGHVKELTLRVRANEKVVASVSLLGVIACTFIGAGYFAPKADAEELDSSIPIDNPYYEPALHSGNILRTQQWINSMKNWKAEKERKPIGEMLNNALANLEWVEEDGSNGATEQKVLLQFPSD